MYVYIPCPLLVGGCGGTIFPCRMAIAPYSVCTGTVQYVQYVQYVQIVRYAQYVQCVQYVQYGLYSMYLMYRW